MKPFKLSGPETLLPKCKNCGKPKSIHLAKTLNCPLGKKHRTVGYTSFYKEKVFEAKE